MGKVHSWSHQVLLEVLRDRDPHALLARGTVSDWDSLGRAATHHGLQGLLALALRARPEVPQDFQLNLQAAAVRLMAQRAAHLRTAAAALGPLEAAGILATVLKGPAVAERYYRDPATRPYGDVDLLVRPEELRGAVAALCDAGFQVADQNWDLLVADLRGQLHLLKANASTVELHWHVVNGVRQRRTRGVTTKPLHERAVPWELEGHACRALPPDVEIPYLCLHAALHGSNYALWLADVGMITRAHDVDWEGVVDLLDRWGARRAGLLVLDLARALVDPGIPELHAAGGHPWVRRTLEDWDLGRADDPPLRKLLFATAADDVATTMRLAADAVVPARTTRSASWARGLRRVSWDTARRIRRKLSGEDWSSPEFRPASGAATIETYLGEVEAYGPGLGG